MRKTVIFVFIFILSLFIVSCDNMERDYLLNGVPAETQDSNEVPDVNDTPDNTEVQDDYTQPDNSDTTSDDENTEDPVCGNTIVESGESCDSNSSPCSSILGDNYEGTAPCRSDCSGFDTSSCTEIEQTGVVYEVDPNKCNGCRKCLSACSEGAISMSGFKAVIDPNKCTGCGDCTRYCSRGAISIKE